MKKTKAELTVQQGFLVGVFLEPSSAPSKQYQKQLRSLLHSQYPLARKAGRDIYILTLCISSGFITELTCDVNLESSFFFKGGGAGYGGGNYGFFLSSPSFHLD